MGLFSKNSIKHIDSAIGDFNKLKNRLQKGIEKASVEDQASDAEIATLIEQINQINVKIGDAEIAKKTRGKVVKRAQRVMKNVDSFLALTDDDYLD